MKKFILIAFTVFVSYHAKAQSVDLRRRVEVTGTAEQEVTPDIIHLSISLKEYMDGKNKVGISQLESQLEQAVKEAGIPKDDFTVSNISSWNNSIQKKKNPDFLAGKQYDLICHDLNRFDEIISKVDPKGIQSTYISRYEYSQMDQLKKDLRIKALISAKATAMTITGALNEKLGKPLAVTENDYTNGNVLNEVMVYRKVAMDTQAVPNSDLSLKKVKVSFQERVIFEIID